MKLQRNLGINVDCTQKLSELETLSLLKQTGFDCFFTEKIDLPTVSALKNKAEALGLDFEFIHAPYEGINNLWLTGEAYLSTYQKIQQTIDSASENGVKTIILHVSSTWNPPHVNDLGFSRYDALVEYAQKKNVRIAFENLRKVGNLACLMDRYERVENVGFCLDIGHEHCYTKTVPFMDLFGERLLCTHIHDNFGKPNDPNANGDLHLLPFDGNIDYQKMIRKLDEYAYKGSLMLEVFDVQSPSYLAMPPESFIQTAFDRIKKISKMSE